MIGVAIAAGAAAGAASSVHCAAMCGPLAAFAGRDLRGAAQYHAARLLAYTVAGSIAGATGTLLGDFMPGRWASALMSWSLALALAWAAWQLWGGARPTRGEPLVSVGKRRPSLTERLFARLPRHPAVVGGLTALLPCGALYTALLLASASGSAVGGALSMLTFGGTSALGLGIVSGLAARARASARSGPGWVSRAFAVGLLVGAVLLVVRPIESLRQEDPVACCDADG